MSANIQNSAGMDDGQMHCLLVQLEGARSVAGVVCNHQIAQLLREEIREARKRWHQPVPLLIDDRLKNFQSEVFYSLKAWEERRQQQALWDEANPAPRRPEF
jgi:hypothetical protein